MKKRHKGRILGRKAASRRALFAGLMAALLKHGSIVTTEAKAKELRRYCEPLITKAKQGQSLHVRRQLLSRLSTKANVERMLAVGQASSKRPGGYLRLTRLPGYRQDNAVMMRVDIIDQA